LEEEEKKEKKRRRNARFFYQIFIWVGLNAEQTYMHYKRKQDCDYDIQL
jgi:hypothetical protein